MSPIETAILSVVLFFVFYIVSAWVVRIVLNRSA